MLTTATAPTLMTWEITFVKLDINQTVLRALKKEVHISKTEAGNKYPLIRMVFNLLERCELLWWPLFQHISNSNCRNYCNTWSSPDLLWSVSKAYSRRLRQTFISPIPPCLYLHFNTIQVLCELSLTKRWGNQWELEKNSNTDVDYYVGKIKFPSLLPFMSWRNGFYVLLLFPLCCTQLIDSKIFQIRLQYSQHVSLCRQCQKLEQRKM